MTFELEKNPDTGMYEATCKTPTHTWVGVGSTVEEAELMLLDIVEPDDE